jgi:two-component system response regulator (stage 0 sporulation protein F)
MSDYVLIVDDDPSVRSLLLDALTLMGIEGLDAANGEQALEMVGEDPPTAIVLDLRMPVLDGFNTLAGLQNKQASRQIPIILLSGMVGYDPRLYRLPGVVGVMSKGSFSLDGFRDLLVKAGLSQLNGDD